MRFFDEILVIPDLVRKGWIQGEFGCRTAKLVMTAKVVIKKVLGGNP